MKLLLDEHISGKVAERLRGLGYDVTAVVIDPDSRSIADVDVFELAQREGRAVVTYEFRGLASAGRRFVTYHRRHDA